MTFGSLAKLVGFGADKRIGFMRVTERLMSMNRLRVAVMFAVDDSGCDSDVRFSREAGWIWC